MVLWWPLWGGGGWKDPGKSLSPVPTIVIPTSFDRWRILPVPLALPGPYSPGQPSHTPHPPPPSILSFFSPGLGLWASSGYFIQPSLIQLDFVGKCCELGF